MSTRQPFSIEDVVGAICVAVVFLSASTCGVVESCARVDAYKHCVELHTPDECVGVKP
jgi:hypothetical protein